MDEPKLFALLSDNVFNVNDIRVGNENVIILTLKNETEDDTSVTSRIVDLRDISQFSYGAVIDKATKIDRSSKYGVNPKCCDNNVVNTQPSFLGYVIIKFDPSLGREDNNKYIFTSKELYRNFIRFLQYESLVDHTPSKNDLEKTSANNSKFKFLRYNVSIPDRGVWLNVDSIVSVEVKTDPLRTAQIGVRVTTNIKNNNGWPYTIEVEGFKLKGEAMSYVLEVLS